MFDSVTPSNIPVNAHAVAGYVNGRYAWSAAEFDLFSDAILVRHISVQAVPAGDTLDVETGDATPAQAPGWVAERRSHGVANPWVYCSLAVWAAVIGEFRTQNIPEPEYWIAAYPGNGAQLYPGSVAHQYQDAGPYDISVVAYTPPNPSPNPPEDEEMPYYVTNSAGTGFIVSTDLSSKAGIPDEPDAAALLATGNYKDLKISDQLINMIPNV
jgi:hypothetical protein